MCIILFSVSTAGDDTLLLQAWNTIGDHFFDRQQW